MQTYGIVACIGEELSYSSKCMKGGTENVLKRSQLVGNCLLLATSRSTCPLPHILGLLPKSQVSPQTTCVKNHHETLTGSWSLQQWVERVTAGIWIYSCHCFLTCISQYLDCQKMDAVYCMVVFLELYRFSSQKESICQGNRIQACKNSGGTKLFCANPFCLELLHFCLSLILT